MSSSNDRWEARRKSKRDWARRESERRKSAGEESYTTAWRKANPEAYEEQKRKAREARKLAKSEG